MTRSLAIVGAAFSLLALGAPAALAAPAVTNTNDSGPGSLRGAIAGAIPGDTIGVIPGTYRLASELVVGVAVTIDGASPGATVIDGQGATRVFRVPSSGAVTLSDLTVRRGRATGNGGGILHDGAGALTLERAMVMDNVANATSGGGGGLYHGNPLAPLTVIDSTVSQNTATIGGTASGGGGLHVQGTQAAISNSTISRNQLRVAGAPTSSGGAGYYADDGGGSLNNVTLVANVAQGAPAGGIFNRSGPGVGLSNTIVGNNSSGCSGAIASGGSNLENTNSCGFNGAGDLPGTPSPVGALESNGGPTLTHRLVPENPGVDAGGAGTACESDDQRGVGRSGVGTACDIGAFEFDGSAVAAVPSCSQSGAIPVTITAVPGHGVQSVQYRRAGGPSQVLPTPEGGSQARRTITFPEGRAGFEYWGDFTNDPSTGQPGHLFKTVLVDRTKPRVTVANPNPFRVFVITRPTSVQVNASDPISGLVVDPSGKRSLDTSGRGSKTFAPGAVDLCTNQATAPFSYRVLAPGLGVRTVLERIRGTVRSQAAGGSSGARASQKGRRFSALREPREIAIRSLVDTARGTVRLTSSRNSATALQDGQFSGGVFQILQSRRPSAKGLTELRLKGSSFRRCRRASGGRASAAARRRRVIRRLRGRGSGRFRTRGRYSAATVRGTTWTVEDRCDGTLTKVTRGRVAVRDFRRRKTVIVRAGKRYLARAPG